MLGGETFLYYFMSCNECLVKKNNPKNKSRYSFNHNIPLPFLASTSLILSFILSCFPFLYNTVQGFDALAFYMLAKFSTVNIIRFFTKTM